MTISFKICKAASVTVNTHISQPLPLIYGGHFIFEEIYECYNDRVTEEESFICYIYVIK